MSAEIEKQTGEKPALEGGGGGIFDVYAGQDRVFCKHEQGRFPGPGEIAGLLEDGGRP